MVDWKRTAAHLHPNMPNFRKFGLRGGPLSHVKDTAYYRYAVQQNLYRNILETCYGIPIKSMSLAQFHPEQSSYNHVPVIDMQAEAKTILNEFEKNG